MMKKINPCLGGILTGLLIITLYGCVIPNPNTAPVVTQTTNGTLVTNFPDKFVIDYATLSNVFGRLKDVNAISAPVNPYKSPIDLGLELGLGVTTLASGLLAWFKNRKLGTTTTALTATIKGVEDATMGVENSPVKIAISDRATAAGVQDFLDQHVQANT
jgi:hypothetical protein